MQKNFSVLYIITLLAIHLLLVRVTYAQLPQKTIAIAGFENLSSDKEFDWIGTGFAETLTTKLIYVKSLKVVERSQIKEIIREQKLQMSGAIDQNTAVEMGKFLDIDFMIIGNYQKSQDELKVTARIMNVTTSKEENFVEVRGVFTDLFNIQDELIFKIARAVNTPVSQREKLKITEPLAKNLSVYEWYTKGADYYDKNEYEKSLEYYEKTLNAVGEKGDERIKSAVLYGIGNIYVQTGNYGKAMEYYNVGLKTIEKTDDEQMTAGYYNNMGIIFNQKGDIGKAVEYYNKSLKIYEKISARGGSILDGKNESDVAITYFNIGCMYRNLKDDDGALIYFNKSLKIAKKVKDEKLTAEVYVTLGNIYRFQKNYKRAIEYCEEGIEVIDKIAGDLQSILYANIGDIYKDSGKYNEAIKYYNKSLETIETGRKIRDENLMALILYNIAVLYGEQNEYKIALHFATKAIDTYQKIGDEKSVLDTQSIVKQFKEELEKEDK